MASEIEGHKRWDALGEMEEKRSEILNTIEDMAVDLALEAVKEKERAICMMLREAKIGPRKEDEISDMIVEAGLLAFRAGCEFGNAVYQIGSSCDSIKRSYGELEEKYISPGEQPL